MMTAPAIDSAARFTVCSARWMTSAFTLNGMLRIVQVFDYNPALQEPPPQAMAASAGGGSRPLKGGEPVPKGPARPWRTLAAHTEQAFPWVRAAIAQGYDVELRITGITAGELTDFRRGLFNAAKHLGISLHCQTRKQPDGTYALTYAVHTKTNGRAHILNKHGPDRQKWPYNPRGGAPRDPDGNRTDI